MSIRDVAVCRRYPSSHGVVAITLLRYGGRHIRSSVQAKPIIFDVDLGTCQWRQSHPDSDPCGEIRQGKRRYTSGSEKSPEATTTKWSAKGERDHRASPQRVKLELKHALYPIRYRNAMPCSGGFGRNTFDRTHRCKMNLRTPPFFHPSNF